MNVDHLMLWQAADLIRSRALSPVELTQSLLEKIEQREEELNCFITLTPELALQQARQAEAMILRGDWRGPLHGIPLALKDLIETAGVRTTAGSLFFADHVPDQDAVVVQRLAEAGAIWLGKTNMHEIALGVTNENPHYGVCRNPRDPTRITGGSSGGSAAALAAGFCLGALGSDTGGSIRIPASLCGVVGLKPTYGRVSLRGVIPLSWNLDHVGPLARSVRDAALLLQGMAGYDLQDPYSQDQPAADYLSDLDAGVQGWRVALASGEFFDEADTAVIKTVQQAAQVFAHLGAKVIAVPIPGMHEMAKANGLMVVSDAASYHSQRLHDAPQNFGVDVRKRLEMGAGYSAVAYAQARRIQSLSRHWFAQFFKDYDLLILPATPVAAPRLSTADAASRAPQLTRLTAPFNLTGLPALSVPCGEIEDDGSVLPVGLQIVGRAWDEQRVLQAAYAFEQARL